MARLKRTDEKAKEFKARSDTATEQLAKVQGLLETREEEKKSVQGELDDLLMVFGDLEDKCTKYREQLRALGEIVSDAEDDDESEEEEEGYGKVKDDDID